MRHYEVFSFADWVTKAYLLYHHCAQWTLFPSKSFSPLFNIPKPGLLGSSHWAFSHIFWCTLASGRQQWETERGGRQAMCPVVPASSPWAVLATVLAVAVFWKPPSNGVLVSSWCHHKSPQTGRLTTTEVDSFPALGGQKSKIKMSAVHAPSDGCRRELFASPSFSWLQAFLGLWLPGSSVYTSVFTWLSLPLPSVCVSSSVRTPTIGFGY